MTVDGAFTEEGVWTVDVVLRFWDGIVPVDRRGLTGAIRQAAIEGIAQEARRGRALGACSVLLQLDGDPDVLGHVSLVNAIGPDSVD